ncbi:MAG: hypothetical protein J6B37_08130 [Clostridia bacterium]|nr:hypothetical protein [Clostridia bacterium]
MKKLISLALALVMMFAVCVPVFAAELNSGTPAGNTTVLVDGAADMGEGTFTVSIPATVSIPWGKTITDVEYSVWSQLQTGKLIKVSVRSTDQGVMSNAAKTATLNYTLSDTTYTTTKSVILATNPETSAVKVNIPTANWNGASIDQYSGTLTFTAELV